jgi:hypothetical protein
MSSSRGAVCTQQKKRKRPMAESEKKLKNPCANCMLQFETLGELVTHLPLCTRIKELEGQVAVLEEKLRALGEVLHDE